MTKKFKSEAELAAMIVEWLAAQGWEVHQEVSSSGGEPRADVVGRYGCVTWVIETKLSLSLSLLEQAAHWTRYANYVSIAFPYSRLRSHSLFLRNSLKMMGIGYLAVRPEEEAKYLKQSLEPRLNRKLVNRKLWHLLDAHENLIDAGTPDGGYWTPFKVTAKALRKFVEENPGCTMKEAVDGIKHHYAHSQSACSNLRGYLRDGVIKGIRLEEAGRNLTLFPIEQKDGAPRLFPAKDK